MIHIEFIDAEPFLQRWCIVEVDEKDILSKLVFGDLFFY